MKAIIFKEIMIMLNRVMEKKKISWLKLMDYQVMQDIKHFK